MLRRVVAAALVPAAACTSHPATRRVPTPMRSPAATASPSPPPAPCRYVFPVQPPSATRYGPSHHDYPATDIFAPRGTAVVSATDGVVEWVSRVDRWEPKADDPATRGGVSVAVIGDDGVRYYGSHLLDVGPGISPGVRVEAGAPLGHVDSTGDAEGIAAHLHFGISHPTTPDDWRVRRGEVSPYRYLNAWKQARAVTPDVPGARQASCVVSAG